MSRAIVVPDDFQDPNEKIYSTPVDPVEVVVLQPPVGLDYRGCLLRLVFLGHSQTVPIKPIYRADF